MERFITTAEVAERLGMPRRKVYELMASGRIESRCINPESERKRYVTTITAVRRWQRLTMARLA